VEGSPGRADCTVCDKLLESWQGPKLRARISGSRQKPERCAAARRARGQRVQRRTRARHGPRFSRSAGDADLEAARL